MRGDNVGESASRLHVGAEGVGRLYLFNFRHY